MSSTNKTEYLNLNSWVGADVPKREDFVNDNVIIDNAISTHFDDNRIHITKPERDKWNSPFYIQSYMGDGTESQTIAVEADFVPTWGLVFGYGRPASLNDYVNSINLNYFGVFTKDTATNGLYFDGSNLTVTRSKVPYKGAEYAYFNEDVTMYCVIFAR